MRPPTLKLLRPGRFVRHSFLVRRSFSEGGSVGGSVGVYAVAS
jgi:hypothetical protein